MEASVPGLRQSNAERAHAAAGGHADAVGPLQSVPARLVRLYRIRASAEGVRTAGGREEILATPPRSQVDVAARADGLAGGAPRSADARPAVVDLGTGGNHHCAERRGVLQPAGGSAAVRHDSRAVGALRRSDIFHFVLSPRWLAALAGQ